MADLHAVRRRVTVQRLTVQQGILIVLTTPIGGVGVDFAQCVAEKPSGDSRRRLNRDYAPAEVPGLSLDTGDCSMSLTIDDLLAMLAGSPEAQRDLLRKWLDKTDEERALHLEFVEAERARLARELHQQLGLTEKETVLFGPRRPTMFGWDFEDLLRSENLLPVDRDRARRWVDAYIKDGKQLHELALSEADRASLHRLAVAASQRP